MTLQDFEDNLDRFGGELDGWPAPLRAEAEALLLSSAAARDALSGMQGIERGLRSFGATLSLPGEVASRAMRNRQMSTRQVGLQRAAWGALAVAVLAIGILVGHSNAGRFAPVGSGSTFDLADESADQLVSAALDPSDTIDVD